MTYSAARTLGVAVLGAVFAAAAAGSASAAAGPLPVPVKGDALGTLTQAVPLNGVTSQVPGSPEALTATGNSLGGVGQVAPIALSALQTANPVGSLLGGLALNR
ncbi:ATP-binding protein [Streptomyces sp. NPDC088725]|uniref:ATP-binding protein n=1 Tax=Streptomyces sp. NPDC088725 TaxID=3365873 RepID=UPI003827196F